MYFERVPMDDIVKIDLSVLDKNLLKRILGAIRCVSQSEHIFVSSKDYVNDVNKKIALKHNDFKTYGTSLYIERHDISRKEKDEEMRKFLKTLPSETQVKRNLYI